MKRDIEASTTIYIPVELAGRVLADDPRRVVAAPAADGTPAGRHPPTGAVTSTLAVGIGGGEVSKEVEVEVGDVTERDEVTTVAVQWHATGPDRLFPSFEGVIEARAEDVESTRVTVRGTYTVPLGPVGRFGDGVIGRRLARQSLGAFVEGMARRLDVEAHRREAATTWHPAPYPVTVRESASGTAVG